MAKLVKSLSNSQSNITFHPLPEDDPKMRRPIITKANTLLGWEPTVTLEKGLEATINQYKIKLDIK